MRLLVGLAALFAPALAVAQPSMAPATAAPAPERVATVAPDAVAPPGRASLEDRDAEAAAPAPAIGLDRRVDEDAASGRILFSDTALTSHRGDVGIGVRMPTAPGASLELRYALSDRIELGVSALVVTEEGIPMVGVQAKGQLWHNDRAAVAIGVQRFQATDSGVESVTVPTVVASTCLDGAACLALFSVSLNGLVVSDTSDVPVFAGASWALGRRLQFVGEIHVSSDEQHGSLTIGYLGLRGASGDFAFDAGIGFGSDASRDDCFDCSSDSEAFPFIAMATRL